MNYSDDLVRRGLAIYVEDTFLPIANDYELAKAVEAYEAGEYAARRLTAKAFIRRRAEALGFDVVFKDQPASSDVHVNAPLGSGRRQRAAEMEYDEEEEVDPPLSLVGKRSPFLVEGAVPLLKNVAPQRFTFSPVYMPDHVDFHGEYSDADTLQKAIWDLSEHGDRQLNLQHIGGTVSGRWVELACIPWEHDAELTVPGVGVQKVHFPANTPWMGVIWEPWAYDAVQKGKLRGLSIEGTAQRAVVDIDLPKVS